MTNSHEVSREERSRTVSWSTGWSRWVAVRFLQSRLASKRFASRLTLVMLRGVVRGAPHTRQLAELEDGVLLGFAQDKSVRAVILGHPILAPSSEVLALATSEDLRSPVSQALAQNNEGPQWSALMKRTICDGKPEGDLYATSLMAVARAAGKLFDTDATEILLHCFALTGQRVNPYEPRDLPALRRRAAIAILEEHDQLDQEVFKRLTHSMWSNEIEIYAAALLGRPGKRAQALASLFASWRPTPDLARRFMGETNNVRTPDTRPHNHFVGRRRWATALRASAAVVGRYASAPVCVGLAVWVTWLVRWGDGPLQPGLGGGLGALAIVAAIHVVSAQLAATRLDGVVARRSTSSVSLAVSYWAALLTVACSVTVSRHPRVEGALTWGSTVSGALFVLGVVWAAQSLVRQSDPACAARVFADNRRRFYRRTGRRQGKLQAMSSEARVNLAQVTYVALKAEPSHMERRAPINAGRRGLLIPDSRRLRRLGSRPMWKSGNLRLHILSTIGTTVSAGSYIAAILPSVDSTVPEAELRAVMKAFRLHSTRTIEAAAEGVSVLVALVGRLAHAGDKGGAERVGEALVDLIETHLVAAARAREDRAGTGALPVMPLYDGALDALLVQLAESQTRTENIVFPALLGQVATIGEAEDQGVFIVAARLRETGADLPAVEVAGILRNLARRALEIGDYSGLQQVEVEARRRLQGDTAGRNHFVELAADIPAMAGWLDQPTAIRAWHWFWETTAHLAAEDVRLMGAFRAGAANLSAGSHSAAIAIALDLRSLGIDIDKVGEWVKGAEYSAREALFAEFTGGYLGDHPHVAISDFAEFAKSVASAVTESATASES